MALGLLVNQDLKITAYTLGGWLPGDPNTPSDMILTLKTASKVKANNKFLLVDTINWLVTPTACTFAGHTHLSGSSMPFPTPGFNNAKPIEGSCIKCKADNLSLMREGDLGKCNGMFTNNSSGAFVPCQCTFQITDAGQIKVKGE